MLSGETTMGKFPIETVASMANICKNAETHREFQNEFDYKKTIGLRSSMLRILVLF